MPKRRFITNNGNGGRFKTTAISSESDQLARKEIRTAIFVLKVFLDSLASINVRSDPRKLLKVMMRFTDHVVQKVFQTFSNSLNIDFNMKKITHVDENLDFIRAASHSVSTIAYAYLAFLLYQAQRFKESSEVTIIAATFLSHDSPLYFLTEIIHTKCGYYNLATEDSNSHDLKSLFPEMKDFAERILKYTVCKPSTSPVQLVFDPDETKPVAIDLEMTRQVASIQILAMKWQKDSLDLITLLSLSTLTDKTFLNGQYDELFVMKSTMKKYIENYKSALSIGDFLSLNYLGIHLAHTLTDLSFAVVEEDRFQYIDLSLNVLKSCLKLREASKQLGHVSDCLYALLDTSYFYTEYLATYLALSYGTKEEFVEAYASSLRIVFTPVVEDLKPGSWSRGLHILLHMAFMDKMLIISEQIEPPFALPYVSREQYMELLLLWRLHNGEEFTLGMLSMLRIIYDFYLEKYLNKLKDKDRRRYVKDALAFIFSIYPILEVEVFVSTSFGNEKLDENEELDENEVANLLGESLNKLPLFSELIDKKLSPELKFKPELECKLQESEDVSCQLFAGKLNIEQDIRKNYNSYIAVIDYPKRKQLAENDPIQPSADGRKGNSSCSKNDFINNNNTDFNPILNENVRNLSEAKNLFGENLTTMKIYELRIQMDLKILYCDLSIYITRTSDIKFNDRLSKSSHLPASGDSKMKFGESHASHSWYCAKLNLIVPSILIRDETSEIPPEPSVECFILNAETANYTTVTEVRDSEAVLNDALQRLKNNSKFRLCERTSIWPQLLKFMSNNGSNNIDHIENNVISCKSRNNRKFTRNLRNSSVSITQHISGIECSNFLRSQCTRGPDILSLNKKDEVSKINCFPNTSEMKENLQKYFKFSYSTHEMISNVVCHRDSEGNYTFALPKSLRAGDFMSQRSMEEFDHIVKSHLPNRYITDYKKNESQYEWVHHALKSNLESLSLDTMELEDGVRWFQVDVMDDPSRLKYIITSMEKVCHNKCSLHVLFDNMKMIDDVKHGLFNFYAKDSTSVPDK